MSPEDPMTALWRVHSAKILPTQDPEVDRRKSGVHKSAKTLVSLWRQQSAQRPRGHTGEEMSRRERGSGED